MNGCSRTSIPTAFREVDLRDGNLDRAGRNLRAYRTLHARGEKNKLLMAFALTPSSGPLGSGLVHQQLCQSLLILEESNCPLSRRGRRGTLQGNRRIPATVRSRLLAVSV